MAFAPSRRTRKKSAGIAAVSLNAMMDMMTIILLFLLKTWSVTGALMTPAIENLPESTSELEPRRTLSVVLTNEGLFEETEAFTEDDESGILGALIVPVEEFVNTGQVTLPSLEGWLESRRTLERSLGKAIPSRELTVQAAGDVPYAWILKLINAASLSDYDVFEFVVLRENGGGTR